LYMVNDSIANSSEGVHANSDTTDVTTQPSPIELALLNNTFYNNTISLPTVAPNSSSTTPINDSVYWEAMDNIFANSSNTAIISDGQEFFSEGQYNLFWQNTTNVAVNGSLTNAFQGINNSVFGNPQFRDPTNGDFTLLPNSAAIDAARSEIG